MVELIVGMFTPWLVLAVKEMLVCVLSLRNTNTVFSPLLTHTLQRESGGDQKPCLAYSAFSPFPKTTKPICLWHVEGEGGICRHV